MVLIFVYFVLLKPIPFNWNYNLFYLAFQRVNSFALFKASSCQTCKSFNNSKKKNNSIKLFDSVNFFFC